MAAFLYGLGIAGFGVANAKLVVKAYKSDFDAIMNATEEELTEIDQVGAVLARDFVAYFKDVDRKEEVLRLLGEIEFVIEENTAEQDLEGMTFVITGSLENYPNRDALKKEIEELKRKGLPIGMPYPFETKPWTTSPYPWGTLGDSDLTYYTTNSTNEAKG